jgi:hypothetical protein
LTCTNPGPWPVMAFWPVAELRCSFIGAGDEKGRSVS